MLVSQPFENSQLGFKLLEHLLVLAECAGSWNQFPSIVLVAYGTSNMLNESICAFPKFPDPDKGDVRLFQKMIMCARVLLDAQSFSENQILYAYESASRGRFFYHTWQGSQSKWKRQVGDAFSDKLIHEVKAVDDAKDSVDSWNSAPEDFPSYKRIFDIDFKLSSENGWMRLSP